VLSVLLRYTILITPLVSSNSSYLLLFHIKCTVFLSYIHDGNKVINNARVCDTGLVYPGYRTLTNISASLVARKTGPNYNETYSDD
jgi:hypothetical protein